LPDDNDEVFTANNLDPTNCSEIGSRNSVRESRIIENDAY